MHIAHPNHLKLMGVLKSSIYAYQSVREEILCEEDIRPDSKPIDPVNFARYILLSGTIQEKRDLILTLGQPIYIKNKFICSSIEENRNY